MKVHGSALKHGVSTEDAIQAAEWSLWIEPLDDGPPNRELRLGFDTRARLLETVVLVFESGEELVNAMRHARPTSTFCREPPVARGPLSPDATVRVTVQVPEAM